MMNRHSTVATLVWRLRVFASRWRYRARYAIAAPFVYRNWWALLLPKLGMDIVLVLRSGLRFHIRARSGDLGVVNEAFILKPYLAAGGVDVPEDGVVVDIGANIGDFSLQAAQRCPTGRVIAVEPVAEHVRILRRHVAMNDLPHVTCVHAAVGATDGVSEIANDGVTSRQTPGGERVEAVRQMTLLALMEEHALQHVDLLKLDCEGAEWDILPAAEQVFPRIRQICMEYHCERGWTPERLAAWLRARGYSVRHTSGEWNGLLWAVRS
jgi:FkbM family methyltransferase